MTSGDWTFLSNHGHVLVALSRDPDSRMRDIAARVGITERFAQRIVGDLVAEGYVVKEKVGRRNQYRIASDSHLRHDLESWVTVADFIALVTPTP